MSSLIHIFAIVVLVAPGVLAAERLIPPPKPQSRNIPATLKAAPRAGNVQWDSGDPTADEQAVLEIINRARADPTAEGVRLGIDIREGLADAAKAQLGPKQPLAMNKLLLASARAHSQDMYTRAFFAHVNPDGNDPAERMTAQGYIWNACGENIAGGSDYTPQELEDLLMIDAGIPERGHRENLLTLYSDIVYREIGVGAFHSATANADFFRDYLTQEFGKQNVGPFIVGVVYDDKNNNNFYDPGEGMQGVTITTDSGNYFAITGIAGGYAIPVAAGAHTITATGSGLTGTVIKTVSVTTNNVKVDFKSTDVTVVSNSQTKVDRDSDGFPDEIETALQTSPTDGNSTPTGAPAVKAAATLTKIAVGLNFAPAKSDSVALTGKLDVPEGFTLAGAKVTIDFGGITRVFTLDGKGANTPKDKSAAFKLAVKSSRAGVAAQTALFTLKLKGDFDAQLSDEDLKNENAVNKLVLLPVAIMFNGKLLTAEPLKLYNAKIGKTGKTK